MYLLIIDKYFKFIKQDIVYDVTNWFWNFFSTSNSEARVAAVPRPASRTAYWLPGIPYTAKYRVAATSR